MNQTQALNNPHGIGMPLNKSGSYQIVFYVLYKSDRMKEKYLFM